MLELLPEHTHAIDEGQATLRKRMDRKSDMKSCPMKPYVTGENCHICNELRLLNKEIWKSANVEQTIDKIVLHALDYIYLISYLGAEDAEQL